MDGHTLVQIPNGPGRTRFVLVKNGELPKLREKQAPGQQWRKQVSQSMSVHPKQAEAFRQFYKKMGVTGVEVANDGRISVGSSKAQYEAAKARGFYNADANR